MIFSTIFVLALAGSAFGQTALPTTSSAQQTTVVPPVQQTTVVPPVQQTTVTAPTNPPATSPVQQTTVVTPTFIPQQQQQCSTNLEGLYLDVVFILDSSKGTDPLGFNGERGALLAFASTGLVVSQTQPQAVRASIITAATKPVVVGDLNAYNSVSDFLRAVKTLSYVSNTGPSLDLAQALITADNVLSTSGRGTNIQKLIVVFTSADDYDCTIENSLSQSRSHRLASDEKSPCRIAANIKNSGIYILTIRLNFNDAPNLHVNGIASPCYALNNDEQMLPEFMKLLSWTNCYCPSSYTQNLHLTKCYKTAECLYLEETPTGYTSAQIAAGLDNGILVDILNQDKQDFVMNMTTNYRPVFIGLNQIGSSGTWKWDTGSSFSPVGSFNKFAGNDININNKCTYLDNDGLWHDTVCSAFEKANPYIYQVSACSAGKFCAAT
uniref:C-type lectin domain-containing protein n=1 Tax=Rhabditophanes sp. KR3021 TaxID=114890 RepID=A0AC35TNQ2_9BILA